MKKIIGVLLLILGIYMLYLGIPAGLRPPMVTGVGFLLIGIAFLYPGKG